MREKIQHGPCGPVVKLRQQQDLDSHSAHHRVTATCWKYKERGLERKREEEVPFLGHVSWPLQAFPASPYHLKTASSWKETLFHSLPQKALGAWQW